MINTRSIITAFIAALLVASVAVKGDCYRGSCANLHIDNCVGTIPSWGYWSGGFNTASGYDQVTMQCGSKATGLRDVTFQFSVSANGLYSVEANTWLDSTIQVATCSTGSVIGCNDDVSSSDKSSKAVVPLSTDTPYVAAVSKRNTWMNEIEGFGFFIVPVCLCSAFAPDACFGTVPASTSGLVVAGLSTSGKADRITMTCGSRQIGLGDYVFQFKVEKDGVYTISTEGTTADTTLTVLTCDGVQLQCNNDKVSKQIYTSEVVLKLSAGVSYVGAVSGYDAASAEVGFSVGIRLVSTTASPTAPTNSPTNPPTNQPTRAPTAAPTKAPTNAPTNLPTRQPTNAPTNAPTNRPTNQPTLKPTNAPTKSPTKAPTNQPTNAPTTASPTYAPTNVPTSKAPTSLRPSQSPTTSRPTRNPTSSPTRYPSNSPSRAPTYEGQTYVPTILQDTPQPTINETNYNFSDLRNGAQKMMNLGVGLGVSAALFALVAAYLVRRRTLKKREEDLAAKNYWTVEEETRLRRLYYSSHDFDYICSVFPNKTRESVAQRVKEMLQEQAMNPDEWMYRNPAALVASLEIGYAFARNAGPIAHGGSFDKQSIASDKPSIVMSKGSLSFDEGPPIPYLPPVSERTTGRLRSVMGQSMSMISSRIASSSSSFMSLFRTVPPPPGLTVANPAFIPQKYMVNQPLTAFSSQGLAPHSSIDSVNFPPPPPLPARPLPPMPYRNRKATSVDY